MLFVCQDKLERMDKKLKGVLDEDEDVEEQIEMLLSGKSYDQLSQIQQSVQAKLQSDEAIDTEYWENLLKNLLVYKAKARLNDIHKLVLNNRLNQLRERQQQEADRVNHELQKSMKKEEKPVNEEKPEINEEKSKEELVEPYDPLMSPKLTERSQLAYEDRQMPVIYEKEDKMSLFEHRRKLKTTTFVARSKLPQGQLVPKADDVGASKADYELEQAFRNQQLSVPETYTGEFDTDDIFTETQEAAKVTYTWDDKNRPRKPRYFNRVHTGYEWNK